MFGFQPRAYNQNVDRIVRRSTIVYSADDIRRAITLCVNEQRPCVLELGDNIGVDAGFTLPIGLESFRIDGADRFRFIVTADIPFLFKALGAEQPLRNFPVEVSNTDVVLDPGASIETVFVVDQGAANAGSASVGVHGVRINGTGGTITSVFGLADGLGATGRVVVDGLQAREVVNLFALQASTSSWVFSSIKNVYLNRTGITPVTIGGGSAFTSFISCIFEQISGVISVDTGAQSTRNFWSVIQGGLIGSFTTNNPAGGLPQTLLRVDGFAGKFLSPDDKDLDL